MHSSYPFTTYSGLLEPTHYKRIGAALWLFLWCISSTTKEVEKDGVTWGVVLGGKPHKLSDLSNLFGVEDRTVSRWLKTLEEHQYIQITRAPYGLIIELKNSKKYRERSDNNVRSPNREQTNMSDLPDNNVRSNKDITKILKDTTTTENGSIDSKNVEPFVQVLDAYCKLHNKIDLHVKVKERGLMHRMIAGGMPIPFITRVMSQVYQERSAETKITSFLYYENPIFEAWHIEQSQTTPVLSGTVAKRSVQLSKQKEFIPDDNDPITQMLRREEQTVE
jgi:DNA-binding MarR family transcriptional regulator